MGGDGKRKNARLFGKAGGGGIESRTPGALTAYLGVTKGTVSQTLMSLERAGLVSKTIDAADRRSVKLELTDAGRDRLRRDEIARVQAMVDAMLELDRLRLDDALRQLLKTRLELEGGRAFGLCRTCRHFAADARGPAKHHCRLLDEPLADAEADEICYEQEAA
ncbi:MarR family transcriptional regulator [Mesorhizobium sp. YM1C-6-2]|nr:MarR family transcriptional regulator [Mesorhizobium sp. YM1C-6-2]